MKDFNGLVTHLDKTYFPKVEFYRDNDSTTKIHYACELYNNGCLTFEKLVKKLSKLTKETQTVIEETVLKFYP